MDSARSPPASDPPRRAQGLNSRQAPIRLTVALEEGEMGFGLPPAEKAGRAGVPMGQQNTNIYTHADTHTAEVVGRPHQSHTHTHTSHTHTHPPTHPRGRRGASPVLSAQW